MDEINVVAAILLEKKQVLIAKRPAGKHKAGYWEFPGGKVEASESNEQALIREIKEELGIFIKVDKLFEQVDFTYPEKKVSLNFYKCTQILGKAHGMEGQEIRWVKVDDLINYQFPEANQPIVERLLSDSSVS